MTSSNGRPKLVLHRVAIPIVSSWDQRAPRRSSKKPSEGLVWPQRSSARSASDQSAADFGCGFG